MASGREGSEARFSGQRCKLHASAIVEHSIGLVDLHAWCGQRRLYVPTAYENIFPAVVIKVRNIWRVSRHGLAGRGHSAGDRDIFESTLVIIAINWESFIVERNQANVGIAVVVEIARIYSHPRNEDSVFPKRDTAIETDLLNLKSTHVVKKKLNILSFVMKRSMRPLRSKSAATHPSPCRDVRAFLTRSKRRGMCHCHCLEKSDWSRLVHFGMAIVAMAAHFAIRIVLQIPAQVVDHYQI